MAKGASPTSFRKRVSPIVQAEDDNGHREELYFTKEGRTLLNSKGPSAYAFSHPWPPCPTNLSKNKVYRPQEEDQAQVVQETLQDFAKEARPFTFSDTEVKVPPAGLKSEEVHSKPSAVSRMPVPEIELALYWDRHPYEFRQANNNNNLSQRAKSAANLSNLNDLLVENSGSLHGDTHSCSADSNGHNNGRGRNSRRSSAGSSNDSKKVTRSSSASTLPGRGQDSVTGMTFDPNEITRKVGVRKNSANNIVRNSKSRDNPRDPSVQQYKATNSNAENAYNNPKVPKILQLLKTSEKTKFNDISKGKSYIKGRDTPPKVVRDQLSSIEVENKPNPKNRILSASSNTNIHNRNRNNSPRNTVGVQVTLEEVTKAALQSTYLCPLHGNYRKGVERRSKSGFRTDMSSTENPHARCSRGRTSRTRLMKSAEVQTTPTADFLTEGSDDFSRNGRSRTSPSPGGYDYKKPRSKTAGPTMTLKKRANSAMISEYHGNYRHPAHIAESENRRLRNKILSYCFTKHSIF